MTEDSQLPPLPRVEQTAHGHRFVIDGRPALLLGGQLHNSTSTDEDLDAGLRRVAALSANIVIGTASWELIEPLEGRFDFTSVDRLLESTRDAGLRLILIWFGAFKNAASTYAPTWVRADRRRFPRSKVRGHTAEAFTYPGGMPKPVLSVFGEELRAADASAFGSLMRHLARTDPHHTVVAVQVENEVGVLGDSRDRSAPADVAWSRTVPSGLTAHLAAAPSSPAAELWIEHGSRHARSWEATFGSTSAAHEVFMAWGFASYIEELTRRGKAEKELPMYANAWLGPQPGQEEPGAYPSGGPASRVLDVWKAAAPSLDFLSPDVYVDDARSAIAPYVRADNPLFVPESRVVTGSLFWALGRGALGFSVFGIDDVRVGGRLSEALELLQGMAAVITDAQADGRIAGVLLEDGESHRFALGGLEVTARGSRDLLSRMLLDAGVDAPPPVAGSPSETAGGAWASPADARAFGIVLVEAAEDDATRRLVVIGQNLTLDFHLPGSVVEIDAVETGRAEAGVWRRSRVVNGDERLTVLPLEGVGVARIRLLVLTEEAEDEAGESE